MEDAAARRKRKEEARQLKRKRIEDHGGVRPRSKAPPEQKKANKTKHRFGRVMESVPCRNVPRHWTLSIAIPGSIVSNCQTRELRTQLVGQIARAATIYQVDEIVVFDDKLATNNRERYYHGRRRHDVDKTTEKESSRQQQETHIRFDPHAFMARLLQYCECPQYLRKHFFPMHPDLQFSGLLAPIDAPHHVRVEERSKYREGVVLEKKGDAGSLVNCGIRGRPVEIDRVLTPGIRCTVKLDPKAYGTTGRIRGKVVSPSAPRETDGTYWGYTTRLAQSINGVFDDCPFEGGYDLKIGTSERGSVSIDNAKFELPTFQHCLVVFGGVAGIEECVDADEKLRIPGSESRKLFDMWVNMCPFQGSRTIRTEEAVLLSLARLSPFVAVNADGEKQQLRLKNATEKTCSAPVDFSDDSPSEESSSEESEG